MAIFKKGNKEKASVVNKQPRNLNYEPGADILGPDVFVQHKPVDKTVTEVALESHKARQNERDAKLPKATQTNTNKETKENWLLSKFTRKPNPEATQMKEQIQKPKVDRGTKEERSEIKYKFLKSEKRIQSEIKGLRENKEKAKDEELENMAARIRGDNAAKL